MEDFEERLKVMESPFNWKLDDIPKRLSATDIIDKIDDKEEVSEPWIHLCVNFTIAYLHYENKDYNKATQILENCDQFLKSTENSCVQTYKESFKSVCYASQAVLATKTSTVEEVKVLLDGIVPLSELSDKNKSAIYAIKAYVFMKFGVYGTKSNVLFAEDALKLNPQEGEWHLLMGKLLSRQRHLNREFMPSSEEIKHLQTSLTLTSSPRAAITLANVYLEKTRCLNNEARKNFRKISDEQRSLTAEAKKLILLALEKNESKCIHIMIRSAYGLHHLPYHDRDSKKSKELLHEALKRSPLNADGNKLAGDIYLHEGNRLEALKYYHVASSKNVFNAELLIFEINEEMGKNTDVENFYSRLLNQYKEKNYTLQTLIHASEFYIFVRKDLFKALHYFLEILIVDPDYHGLKGRFVKYIQQEVHFFKIMYNESRIAIEKKLYKNVDEQTLLENAILKMKQQNPQLMEQPIEYNLIQKLIDDGAAALKRKVSGRGGKERKRFR